MLSLFEYSPDWRMAMHESCEDDMASSVRDMSSLSCVPSIDSSEYTISTCSRTRSDQHESTMVTSATILHANQTFFWAQQVQTIHDAKTTRLS